jgi:uncharacterized RDD family membrane protein YckC
MAIQPLMKRKHHARPMQMEDDTKFIEERVHALSAFSAYVIVILGFLKLVGFISISWWLILSPLWISIILIFLLFLLAMLYMGYDAVRDLFR